MPSKTFVQNTEQATRNSYAVWRELMDGLTGGSFSKGKRPATASERIAEFDALMPEQLEMLRSFKGDDWLVKQTTEIDKLRRAQEHVVEAR